MARDNPNCRIFGCCSFDTQSVAFDQWETWSWETLIIPLLVTLVGMIVGERETKLSDHAGGSGHPCNCENP